MSRPICAIALMGMLVFSCSIARAESTFGVPDDRDLPALGAVTLAAPSGQSAAGAAFLNHSKELTGSYPAADFDPDALAAKLGPGIEPVFDFVRDHIRFESYPGAFRGDGGTYRSRAGNAADRSLLLARLLKSKGVETRFVTGQLPPEKAEVLFQRIFEPAKGESFPPSPSQEKKDLSTRIRARAAHDYAAVRAALGENLPAGGGIDHDVILRELSSHVWLQAKSGDDWLDLDSSFADAKPGKTYAPATGTFDQLPSDTFQQLTMRVSVERLDGGSLKPETVLELTRPVCDLVDKQIFLMHGSPRATGCKALRVGQPKSRPSS